MFKTISFLGTVLSFCFAFLFAQTATPPAIGSGTESDPYQIATLDNLYWIADSAYRDDYYIQTADINAAETATWFPTDTGGYYGWKPIGYFKGSYDGQGHIIDSLYISRDSSSYIGLFGGAVNSIINNLGLTHLQIKGKNRVGGLVGYSNSSVINNCYCNDGYVTSVMGNDIGGIIGASWYTDINNCFSRVYVNGENWVGGLIGNNNSSSIDNCYCNADVTALGYGCGGIAGCVINSIITNSYSNSKIIGIMDIGGFIGLNFASNINYCFWDMQTSGLDSSAGGSGRTTAEMKTQSTYTDSGWNFTDVWMIDPEYNGGYPVLRWHPGVGVDEIILPESALLNQNYPNPLNPITTISWQLPVGSKVELTIYDIAGRKIQTLINKDYPAGYHTINWDASEFNSGIYFYRLNAGEYLETKKMVLVK